MNIYFQKIKNCFRLQFKQLFLCHATLDCKFLMFNSQQYLFKPFIYRFTTVMKYNPKNLQNLEFPNPFKPIFNSQWYMFLNQLFD